MQLNLHYPYSCSAIALAAITGVFGPAARADEPAPVRPQAIVNFTLDEASGDAVDSAIGGSVKDTGALQNGAIRMKSPFWGQSGRQALVLDAAARQFVQVADSPDLD